MVNRYIEGDEYSGKSAWHLLKNLARSFLMLNEPFQLQSHTGYCSLFILTVLKKQSQGKLFFFFLFPLCMYMCVCMFYRYVVIEEGSSTQTQSLLIWLALLGSFLGGFHVSTLTG